MTTFPATLGSPTSTSPPATAVETAGAAGIAATPVSPPVASVHPNAPTEIYTRIARGANICWFGPQGSLKATHVFHADVQPPTSGGAAEIVLQQRDPVTATSQSPRSLRAFRIVITASGDGSHMSSENLRFPETVGKTMQEDVARWAKGETGCSIVGTGGWGGQQVPITTSSTTPPAKKKALPKARAAAPAAPAAK